MSVCCQLSPHCHLLYIPNSLTSHSPARLWPTPPYRQTSIYSPVLIALSRPVSHTQLSTSTPLPPSTAGPRITSDTEISLPERTFIYFSNLQSIRAKATVLLLSLHDSHATRAIFHSPFHGRKEEVDANLFSPSLTSQIYNRHTTLQDLLNTTWTYTTCPCDGAGPLLLPTQY